MANLLANEFENKFPKAIGCLFRWLEDSLTFYDFPLLDSRKIASNNGYERANVEIRRRSRVVVVFPSMDSYMRLLVSYLMEYEDDNQTSRCYIKRSSLLEQRWLRYVA